MLNTWWILPLVIVYIPLQLIHTANPDWRLVYWFGTFLALSITLLYIKRLGGIHWVRYFAPAVAMILFAVPWITFIENYITNALMGFVAQFTVEVLNLSGIYAIQKGNVILLQGAVVGIEEACSGVRSLQSSLMAGYLFGEILRFRPLVRLLLILSGVAVTFFLNLVRTLSLTYITFKWGDEAFESWHDPIGNGIAIGGFLAIAAVAWLIHRIPAFHPRVTQMQDSKAPVSPKQVPIPLQSTQAVFFVSLIGLSFGLSYLWYLPSNSPTTGFDYSQINWTAVGNNVNEDEIDPFTTAQLKYSKGSHHDWISPQSIRWNVFYFYWDKGRISSHAGIHRPENCLPATGMQLTKTYDTQIWRTPEGYEIPFKCMMFEGSGRKTYVFFTVWDENGAEPWISMNWFERIADVFKHRIVKGRHSLQFLAENASSFELAREQWQMILEKMYTPSPLQSDG